jgi:hypothetical protein
MAETKEKLSKVAEMLVRIVAMDKIVGGGRRVSPSDVEPDGRKVKKALRKLLDAGEIIETDGNPALGQDIAYVATELLYNETVAEAPADTWKDEHDYVGDPLPRLTVYNLKWIAEHLYDYHVVYVKNAYNMVREYYFTIDRADGGRKAWQAYVDFHHENPFDLRPVAVRKQLLVAKIAEARDETIRLTMSHNLVNYLAKQGHIGGGDKDKVVRKSDKGRRGLPGLGPAHEGLGDVPENWPRDVQAVLAECAAEMAKLSERVALFTRLSGIDWKTFTQKLAADCEESVKEHGI